MKTLTDAEIEKLREALNDSKECCQREGYVFSVALLDEALSILSSPHVVSEPVANRWYLGSLNDGLFIINRCPTPNATDFPPHDDYGPDVVLNVVALTEKQAQEIVDAHNATLDAPQQTAPVTEARSLSVPEEECPECCGLGRKIGCSHCNDTGRIPAPSLNTQDGVDEREEFEKWATWLCMDKDEDGDYDHPDTHQAWCAWQARSNLSKNTLTRSDT